MCKMEAFSNPSFSSVVSYQPIESPNGRSIAGNCEIWNNQKLHEGLTEDELVDVAESKFKILISSPETEEKYGLSF